jgi:DNA replication and repair protein RecF
MILTDLIFSDFRNLAAVRLKPSPGFNIFYGSNAQGKTNVLEGIYLLGTFKSFRAGRNEELIFHAHQQASLATNLSSRGIQHKVELFINRQGKKIRLDGKEPSSNGGLLGNLRPVLFAPEEIGLVKGAPTGRRALIDRAIFQTDSTFLGRAQEFARILRHRNHLLKEDCRDQELTPWTEGLIRTGARLRRDRYDFLCRLKPLLQQSYRYIAGGREEADINYTVTTNDEAILREELRRELTKERQRERRYQTTIVGPHRDDPGFVVDGRPLKVYGSQGQQRSFILAFKTAQILDLEEQTGDSPVLLLDDMTSELDRRRQEYFFKFILDRKGQVFITTTEHRSLLDQGLADVRIFRVEAGTVTADCGE